MNNSIFNYKIKMNGLRIYPSDYIKYLGIYLDSFLNCNFNCEILGKKLKRANGMLCKARHYVPLHELISIYHAIFSSHLIYGCQIWGQVVNVHNETISKIQNKAMRILSFADFYSNSNPLYKNMNIIKIKDFVSMQNCLFVHDFLNKKLPECFDNYFKTTHDIHSQGTRASSLGQIFQTNSNTTTYCMCMA